jgi:capsular exopolysaccharide synthesis family protein
LPDLAKNTTFHELQVQLAVADGEYARMAAQFKPSYWAVAELKSKRDKIKTYIDGELRRVGEATQSAYRAAREKEDRLRARFEEQKRKALEQKDAGVEYALLEREAATNRALYDSVLQRMKEMTVAVEVRASNMSVADRAVPPTAPSGAGRLKSIGFAALLAAIAGLVLAYVRDAVDDTVKTADDVERWGRMPSLAVVPDESAGPEPIAWWTGLLGRGPVAPGPAIVVRGHARPACTDAYRELRTALLLSRPGGPPRTLLVASGAEGEGKTLTAANLAVAFSQISRSVLLVDADLRRPSCHRLFGLRSTPGLTELLTGQCTLDEVLQPVDDRALSVLPAGATPPNPTELLGSGEMRILLTEVASRFDYVVIDSPAAFGVADATVLSTVVDGVLVVARGGRTRRRHLRALRSRLARARAPIVGVVLNGGDDASTFASPYHTTVEVPPASSAARADRAA